MSGILQPWQQAHNNYRIFSFASVLNVGYFYCIETTSKIPLIFVVDIFRKLLQLIKGHNYCLSPEYESETPMQALLT